MVVIKSTLSWSKTASIKGIYYHFSVLMLPDLFDRSNVMFRGKSSS